MARRLKLGLAATILSTARGQDFSTGDAGIISILATEGTKFDEIMARHTMVGSSLTPDEVTLFKERFAKRSAEVAVAQRSMPDYYRLEEIFFEEEPAITEKMVDEVNRANVNWKAKVRSWGKNMSVRSAKVLLGFVADPDAGINGTQATHVAVESKRNGATEGMFLNNPELNVQTDAHAIVGSSLSSSSTSTLPESFDSREQWTHCAETIGHVRNQGKCGSCWAQAAAGSMDGRLCIASQGKFSGDLAWTSAGYITSCYNMKVGPLKINGCNGGNPGWALKQARKHIDILAGFKSVGGIPTGSQSKDTCVPYFAFGDALTHFEGSAQDAPECPKQCTSSMGYSRPLKDDLFYPTGEPVQTKTLTIAKRGIMEGGPIPMAFDVYKDFMSYDGGNYQRISNEKLGGHATTMIGWKLVNGVDYVLSVNSWGTDWGEDGLFNMHSECCNLMYFIPTVENSDEQNLPLPAANAHSTPYGTASSSPLVGNVGTGQEPSGSTEAEAESEFEAIPIWIWGLAASGWLVAVCTFAWVCCRRSSAAPRKTRSYKRLDPPSSRAVVPGESRIDSEAEPLATYVDPPTRVTTPSAASTSGETSSLLGRPPVTMSQSLAQPVAMQVSRAGYEYQPFNAMQQMMPVQVMPQVQVRQAAPGAVSYIVQ